MSFEFALNRELPASTAISRQPRLDQPLFEGSLTIHWLAKGNEVSQANLNAPSRASFGRSHPVDVFKVSGRTRSRPGALATHSTLGIFRLFLSAADQFTTGQTPYLDSHHAFRQLKTIPI